MTGVARDIAATSVTALALLVYAVTHERWDVWLVGDHRRWAAVAILLLAAALLAITAPARAAGERHHLLTVALALALGIIAVVTGALAPLSLLVALMIAVWFVAGARNVWHDLRPPGLLGT